MDYQARYKKNKGFSLVEILIVLGIFTVLASVSILGYLNFTAHSNLEISTVGLVESIRFAQSSSQAGVGDSKWGVQISLDQVTIFKGDSYTTRDSSFDQIMGLSSKVIASGLSEIVFEKLMGSTVNTGVITLSNNSGLKNISINEKGILTYE